MAAHRCRLALALGTSVLAMASSAAHAQCAPDPTVANATSTCSGSDPDGLTVTTDGSTVVVAKSASTGSMTVNIPAAPNSFTQRLTTIGVLGRIDGGAQSGVVVQPGTPPANGYDFYGTSATLTLASGAQVGGLYGVAADGSGNGFAPALVTIDNAGSITGTSGIALVAINPARGGFAAITNAASGTIGAISGGVGTLANVGTIDGGSLAAIDQTTTFNSGAGIGTWSNSGTIRSASTAATIANLSQSHALTNSGTIANSGTGAAIQGGVLSLVNLAGGRISSAGTVALAADTGVTLVNAGTIVGDVVAAPSSGTGFFSTIDSTAGQIMGNVSLGGGNDLLYARYDGTTTLVTGVTGTIDAGQGTDSVVLAPAADLRIASAIMLPSGFERLRLAPATGATLTLANGFAAPSTIEVAGGGTIVNEATIITTGQAFLRPYYVTGGVATLVNKGVIQASPAQYFRALDLGSSTFVNSGRIDSTGEGISMDGKFTNSGAIVAAGTAFSLFGDDFDNSGTIRSTGGIGVVLSGNSYYAGTNSGRIEGATYGVITDYRLDNSGTIAAGAIGTAVGLSNYGVINNLAGGVIVGGAYAITGHDPYGSTSVYNGRVLNAGTINGDVTFVPLNGSSYGNNANIFVALPGGVLNGNLTLGAGDTLVTDSVNGGPGSFAGITGTVTGTGALLRYRVSGQASAAIGPVGPFATTGYELATGTTLTLTAPANQLQTLVLAGSGTVDLTATIATSDQPAVNVVPVASTQTSYTGSGTGGLTIINRGTLTGTTVNYYSGAFGVVGLGTGNTLDNRGTIRAINAASYGGTSYNAAVVFGSTLINGGRIELDGSYGTYNVDSVTNSGTIVQTGSGESLGIVGAFRVTNSGTIQTAGLAISGYYGTVVTNTGTIATTGTTFGAIRLDGTVSNAGTIRGDVFLGYNAGYFANGGTLVGDLTLGSGSIFLQSGVATGVSGTISTANSIYGRALTASGTLQIGAAPAGGFTDAAVAALGSGTVATLTGVDAAFTDLYAAGDGAIVNRAALQGVVHLGGWSGLLGTASDALGGFTNSGDIARGVYGTVTAFTNTGMIGGSGVTGIYNAGALSFSNSGRIATAAPGGIAVSLGSTDTLVATNTATIAGGMVASARFASNTAAGTMTIANTGTIGNTAGGSASPGLLVAAWGTDKAAGGAVSIDNSGTIAATGGSANGVSLALDGSHAPISYALRNSGSIAAASTTGATAVRLSGSGTTSGTISNSASGSITASGLNAVAIQANGTPLLLDNAGRIAANGSGAVAIAITGSSANTIGNTGTITGATMLAGGADTVDNSGRMDALSLGDGNDRAILRNGAVNPLIDGGAGDDRVEITGTAGGAAITLGSVANVESLRMSGGLATISDTAAFNDLQLSGGRLIGLAGSVISAPTIMVGTGATFGSAGTVNGAITVAGTLSPGASPGTMTVNGNVALGNGSTSLFEITPTVSDKLVVNGALSIASGATLQLVQTGTVTPGIVLDLITATGGISGSFTNVLRNGASFGIFSQDTNRLRVVALFAADPSFSDAAQRGVDYVNGVLLDGRATPSLLASMPLLLTSTGGANAAAFAQLGPQAYAATRQVSLENGLTLVDVARGQAFAPEGDMPGPFTFASVVGGVGTLEGDPVAGTVRARTNGYGFLAGIGVAGAGWSIGAFGGYLNGRQTLAALDTRTTADGVVAGVHGRLRYRGFGLKATLAYDGAHADTRRALPGGRATSDYDLHGYTADVSIDTQLPLTGPWTVRPAIGATAIRTSRDGVMEGGGSPFALTVAGRRGTAVFVDGGITFAGAAELGRAVSARPYVTLGARYQVRGRMPFAVAGLGGGDIGLLALGATRAPVLATLKLGIDVLLSSKLVVFGAVSGESGDSDRRAAARVGLRLGF